jgi:DNA modification methylase
MTAKTATRKAGAKKPARGRLEVQYVPIASLKPWKANPRNNDEAVASVVRSIERFGYTNPVLVRRADQRIIAGHTRIKALQQIGETHAPVIFLDLGATDADLYAIFDNKSTENTPWDPPKLADLFANLMELKADVTLTGFSPEEIQGYTGAGSSEPDPKDDVVPEPPKKAITKPGDLWILGEHRLLCGDSTKVEDVERVMGGEKAGLMNTDPPYGIAYDNRALHPNAGPISGTVANDDLVDEKLQQFLESAFSAAVDEALKTDAAWYLWHAHLTQGFFAAAAAAAANVVLHRQIIWVKPVLVFGRGQYHWKHEPCFMGWVQGNQPPDYGLGNGERTQTTVWEIASVTQAERKEFDHSTPKPVELFTIPIVKHLKTGELCYEPFAGSGPQFIAAEKLGRRCYGMEIDPVYCDVIVARWEKFTGGKAKREKA